ncbi:peptidylprolyl isomerase [Mucilaginibacter robiniae]|uniref:Periplasmic chaperone PpiD n=1 Tax=Mucilaginibacter robiniae TaxID=2728022 RepID=A0A7L5DY39_9SPHI|nr:peptidylprolyl isomerase [Mucilaginibacter robiniae]QJD95681.1 peptidylprolyl isomerase [Mucilaginibacter robiniae]
MGIMGFLRERMGIILVVLIGFALFAFVAGEVITYSRGFLSGDRDELGEVAGEKISYADFSDKLKQNVEMMQQQYGQSASTPQLTDFAQEQTWNQEVSRVILKKEIEKVGIVVGTDETKAMISGKNPSQQIAQYFTDPKTGQLNRASLDQVLSRVQTAKAGDPMIEQWDKLVASVIEGKKAEKYFAMVHNGLYVNSLDAKDDYEAKNKLAKFTYAILPYSSIADNKVNVTDDDYQNYYDEHKGLFKSNQELRSIDYVVFNAAPSKADSAAIKAQMDKLVDGLKSSTNDSLFVQVNAETKAPLVYQRKGQLEPKLDSIMFNAANGFVYGPYVSGNSYKIAKLVDSRVGPDSVKARHILLNPATSGGIDKAMAKADSLKKAIQGGKSFADLAKTFSEDKQSAEKGGELGTFGRGAMIPVFEDAVFNGKAGDFKIVSSQYGVHLIEIESQKGSSKVVKVAVVDKPVDASGKTQSAAYSKAQSFLGSVNKDNFAQQAKQSGMQIRKAADFTGVASSMPGLENARELVKWAYKSDKGDLVDQVYTSGDQYVVAQLTQVKPKGVLSLDAVKEQIKPQVINEVKAKQLTEKLQSASNGASSVEQVAQKAGTKAVPVENIVFANPVIPGLSIEYKVIGSVFGAPLKKLSKPVEGQSGVYVYSVDSFLNPAPLTNTVREREQISQTMLQRADNQIFDALKDKANVKDFRAKFL